MIPDRHTAAAAVASFLDGRVPPSPMLAALKRHCTAATRSGAPLDAVVRELAAEARLTAIDDEALWRRYTRHVKGTRIKAPSKNARRRAAAEMMDAPFDDDVSDIGS